MNPEGYRDPTADTACGNVLKLEQGIITGWVPPDDAYYALKPTLLLLSMEGFKEAEVTITDTDNRIYILRMHK